MVREEEEAELECYDGCPCNYYEETEADTLAAKTLMNLYVESPMTMATEIEMLIGENRRLNERINNLEVRLAHVENRSDSPPPLVLQDSNPQWQLDTAFYSYYS